MQVASRPANAMQFLDTKPFTHDERRDPVLLAAMERYRISDAERMRQVLAQLQRLEAPVVIGLPETGAFFSATLWSVDAAGDRLVFHAAREPKVAVIVKDPGRLWGAAYDANRKVQFDLRGRTLGQQADFWVVGAHMPSALFVLPRRTDVRARHADGQEPVVRFTHPQHTGVPLELRVHDISRGGLAILAHPDEAPLTPGMQVHGAQVELEPGDVIQADFRVQNVLLHDEADATFRFGCAWAGLAPDAEQRVQDWTQRARRRKQMLSLSLDL
ncbi:MAG: flagellar brake protein [Rubrivivax sp.]|nr:flagellar brake protein [Rubrivivax sp.]